MPKAYLWRITQNTCDIFVFKFYAVSKLPILRIDCMWMFTHGDGLLLPVLLYALGW